MGKLKQRFVFIALAVTFIALCSWPKSTTGLAANKKIIPLTSWMYCAGYDSAKTNPVFNEINKPPAPDNWILLSDLNKISPANDNRIIWLKTKLPEWQGNDPAVYLGQISYSIRVFLDSKFIYQWGNFTSTQNKYIRWNQNLVRLPYYNKGTEMLLEIRMGKECTGIAEKVIFGSSLEIMRTMFLHDSIGFIFLAITLMTVIVISILYFILRKAKLLFGLVLFLLAIGFFFTANTSFFQLMFNLPSVFYHANYISYNMAPISFFFLIEQVVADKYKIIINCIWKIKIASLFLTIIILNLTSLIFYDILKYSMILNTLEIIIGITVLLLSMRKSNYERKIFIIGTAGIFFSIIIEFMLISQKGLISDYGFNLDFIQLGVFIFVLTIIWLAIHNYLETYREKEKIQQNELESIKRENEARLNFSAKLIESQETERNRIALELHDSVGQKLLLIKNKLLSKIKNSSDIASVHPLQVICDLAGETIQEIRNITSNLRPQYLDQLGLTAAIEAVIEKVSDTSDIKFFSNIDEIDELLSKTDEVNFFRIIQEGLNNIVKHSGAAEACINIKRYDGRIYLEIKDNGSGFKKNGSPSSSCLGITGMKERSRILGAEFHLSTDKQGTIIKMEYPVNNSKTTFN